LVQAISCLLHATLAFVSLLERTIKKWKPFLPTFISMLALVIDDSMLIRHTVCRFLESRGFKVETATNGIAALELLQSVRPDLIVTDLQMPKLSGYELIDTLKADEKTANIPILVLAAKPSADLHLDKRIHTLIHKDLNVEEQMQQALENLFPRPATS
jgi:CheY-like chemotaxis protein